VLNRIIKILLYIGGVVLGLFDIIYAIALSMVDLLPENALKVAIFAIIAIALIVIAKMSD
jgi:hypothetical protein